MTDRIVPPEFQIRETQVMEFEEPNPDVFYPNNQGATGWSPLPPKLDRQVSMDPAMRYGQDSAAAAAQAGSDAMANLVRQTGINQINTTRVTEREGGSAVTYHEPTRDDQISSVAGQQVTGDPENVQQALLVGDRPTERAPTVSAYQARGAMNRQTAGMNEGTRMAYLELIRQKGTEAIESVSSGLSEAIGTKIVKSTDSGIPWYDQLHGNNPALIELKEIMRYHGERQRKGAAKPMAKYHPSQSNYRSRHGSFGSLNPYEATKTMLTQAKTSISDSLDTRQLTEQVQPSVLGTRTLDAARHSMLAQYGRTLFDTQGTAPPTGVDSYSAGLVGQRAGILPTRVSAPSEPIPGMGLGEPAPTAGNGNEDSMAYIGEDGMAYYAEPAPLDFEKAGMSRNMKIGLAVAAGVGLLLLLK